MREYSDKALRTRGRILDAASRLFYQNGYNATGLDSIIAEAGVTKGNFYYHFKTKQELAAATVEWYKQGAYRDLHIQPVFPGEGPLEILFRVLGRLVDRTVSTDEGCGIRGCYFGNLALELSINSEVVRRALEGVFREMRGAMTGLLLQAREAGEIDPGIDPQQAASLVLALIEGAVMMAKTTQDDGEARRALEFIKGWLAPGRFTDTLPGEGPRRDGDRAEDGPPPAAGREGGHRE